MLCWQQGSRVCSNYWAELECPGSPVGHCITPPSANLPPLTRPLPSCRGYIAATSGAAGRGGNYLNYYIVDSMWWQRSFFCAMILTASPKVMKIFSHPQTRDQSQKVQNDKLSRGNVETKIFVGGNGTFSHFLEKKEKNLEKKFQKKNKSFCFNIPPT